MGLLMFALVACGGENKDAANNDTETKTEAKTEANHVMQDSGTVGDFTVAIKSAKLEKSYKLQDKTTPIQVEVQELFSFNDQKIT